MIESKKVKDITGKEHIFNVHPNQKPLPHFYNPLPEDLKNFFQSSDYHVQTDVRKVERLLKANAGLANIGVDAGSKKDFPLRVSHAITSEKGWVSLIQSRGASIEFLTEHQAGVASTIGDRLFLEDSELIYNDQLFCAGIFDGHGGVECAKFASVNFPEFFTKWMRDPLLAVQEKHLKIYNALHLTFADMNRSFNDFSGTTANVCLIIDNEIWVANLGDSRAILMKPRTIVQLSEDQKPEMEPYRTIIEERGGEVYEQFEEEGIEVKQYDDGVTHYYKNHDRIFGDPQSGLEQLTYKPKSLFRIARPIHEGNPLALSPGGSLGDHEILGAMNPHPTVTRFALPKHGDLVLCCDGIFEGGLSSNQVGAIVRTCRKYGLTSAGIAANIVQNAYDAGSHDNMSVIVVPL